MVVLVAATAVSQEASPPGDSSDKAPGAATDTAALDTRPRRRPQSPDPPGMSRLLPDADLWIDKARKRVVMDGEIAMRQGQLEMFACIKNTKEHESIVAVDVEAMAIHAALLALGAAPGSPAQFRPEYKPASGTTIDITVIWTDPKGVVQRRRAQEWVRNSKTQKDLEQSWVFAGSRLIHDEVSGQNLYQAQGGDLICLANFPSAMLDLPIESSQTNAELAFEAATERIPPRGTRVRLVLTPRLEKDKAADKAAAKSE